MNTQRAVPRGLLLLSTLGLYGLSVDSQAIPLQVDKLVRVVYLSPADRPFSADYSNALTDAARDLRRWFAGEMDGHTFSLPGQPVTWYQTPNPVSWYPTDPLDPDFDAGRFWESALADAFSLTGGRFQDDDNRWLFYIDADPLPGQYMGGTTGVALFPANDLRGVSGGMLVPINPGDPSINPGFDRWVGGMGHELGHAMGLDHPPDSPNGPDDLTLMYWGYLTYPDTYLRDDDKRLLLASGFFAGAIDVQEPRLALLTFALGLLWIRRTRATLTR